MIGERLLALSYGLTGTRITDLTLSRLPAGKYFFEVNVSNTGVTDAGVRSIRANLRSLNVSRTRVRLDRATVDWVNSQPDLKSIWVEGNDLSPEGVTAIRARGRTNIEKRGLGWGALIGDCRLATAGGTGIVNTTHPDDGSRGRAGPAPAWSCTPNNGRSPLHISTPLGVPLASPVPGDSRRPDRVEWQRHGLCPRLCPIILPVARFAHGARELPFPVRGRYMTASRAIPKRVFTPREFPHVSVFQNVGSALDPRAKTPRNPTSGCAPKTDSERGKRWFVPTVFTIPPRFRPPTSGRKNVSAPSRNPFATTAQQTAVG